MGGESVQLSQAQKRRMEAMSMNMGTRIVCGYLASLLFLGISLYLAVTYHTSGDLQSFLVLSGTGGYLPDAGRAGNDQSASHNPWAW